MRLPIVNLFIATLLLSLTISSKAQGENPFLSKNKCATLLQKAPDLAQIRAILNRGTKRFGKDLITSLRYEKKIKVKMSLSNGEWISEPSEPFHCAICVYASDRLFKNLKELFPQVKWQRVHTLYPFQGVYLHDYIVAENFNGNGALIIDPTIRQFFYLKLKAGEISPEEFQKIPRIFVGTREEVIHLFQYFGILKWRIYFETEPVSSEIPFPEL